MPLHKKLSVELMKGYDYPCTGEARPERGVEGGTLTPSVHWGVEVYNIP